VAYGGRGSAKSWSFARMAVIRAAQSKIRVLCARELQNSIKDSVHKLLSDQIEEMGLSDLFDVGESFIRCKNGSEFIFKGLRTNTKEIKSMERISIAWIEEAQAVSKSSWDLLDPTIRAPGSEIWITYNPDNEEDPIHQIFVENMPPPNSKVVKINWDDNPWFPAELEEQRAHMEATDPDTYSHVWGGECKRFAGGAVYGKEMDAAELDGRITNVPYTPSVPTFTVWDLGYSDQTAIWFNQLVGKEPRAIDYYENNLEALDHYVAHIRSKSYHYSHHILPHDAAHKSLRTGKSLAQQLEDMGLGKIGKEIIILPINSIAAGIELARQTIPQMWFDKEKCKQGIRCLKKYHYKYDEDRNIFSKEPYHDWSSNGADAFRYGATYMATRKPIAKPADTTYDDQGGASWMAG
jgi:phage terminase large subunit